MKIAKRGRPDRSDSIAAIASGAAASAVDEHVADTTDAHDASAIGFTPAGTIAATDVQAAIEEVAGESLTNPMTALDDIIVGGTVIGGVATPDRLGKGSDGQVLTVDPTTHHLLWADPAGGSLALDDLTDVNAPAPSDQDVLTWDDGAGEWIAQAPTGGSLALDDLTDVNAPSPSNGDFLSWDSTPGEWVNVGAPSGTVPDGTDPGDLLVWDGAAWDVLPIGADDEVPIADSGEALGIRWGAGGSGNLYGVGVVDLPPASPNAADDEFESYSGWTKLGTLDVENVTDLASHLHIKRTTSGQLVDGVYKTIPTPPITMTVKFTTQLFEQNYQMAGIMVLEAGGAGKINIFGGRFHSSFNGLSWEYSSWTDRTTHTGSDADTTGAPGGTSYYYDRPFLAPYIRRIITSSTDITSEISFDGIVWRTVYANSNVGFTVGAVGMFLYGYNAVPVEAYIDWVRFT